jgi:hypothetical protein
MRYDRSPEAMRSKILGKIVIWNMTEIIFAIAMAIWITDNSLFLLVKCLLQIPGESLAYLVT